jgi:hypothetical protein
MSSKTSTEALPAATDTGFRPWHLYVLLSMIGATAAVMVSKHTHPAALLVLSAAVMAAGGVGLAVHRSLTGFAGRGPVGLPIRDRAREAMLGDKALVLRSIKELEFDHATGKVSDEDFKEMNHRLRVHAMSLMEALDREAVEAPSRAVAEAPKVTGAACASCKTVNDTDAKFCKHCGSRLA